MSINKTNHGTMLNYKNMRKNAWNITFKRGFKPWLTLVIVCTMFAILGVSESSQATFLNIADHFEGKTIAIQADNYKILETYFVDSSKLSKLPFFNEDLGRAFINGISNSNSWLIHLLGANMAYIERNSGEVIAVLILATILSFLVRFFIQSASILGKFRYVMETRYSKTVPVGRVFSPFHRRYILHLVYTMFIYRLVIFLWTLTIIGGFYKSYQYRFIPYILAENPSIKWKDAKKMSIQMTNGLKWKLFLADLSCFHIQLLRIIPVLGLCVTVPFEAEFHAEQYFLLRQPLASDPIFIEHAFNRTLVTDKIHDNNIGNNIGNNTDNITADNTGNITDNITDNNTGNITANQPDYLLKSVSIDLPEELKIKRYYSLQEHILMFFLFSTGGWLWEVCLHIVRNHVLVNRGTMYGPWLPIYGVGGVTIVFLLDRFKANKAKFFSLTLVVCGILEFFTSWILDFFYNSRYWNYDDMILNINGRICLTGLILFGIGGMASVYIVAPKLNEFLKNKNKKTINIICIILSILFIIDLLCCAKFGFNKGSGVGGNL